MGVGLDATAARFGMLMAKQISVIMPMIPEMATAPMMALATVRWAPTASSPRSAHASKPPMVKAPSRRPATRHTRQTDRAAARG